MFKAGFHNGRHYTEYVDQVKQLTREKRLEEAEQLLMSLVDATESEARQESTGVAPWYYEHLAMIYRKNKDLIRQLSILERFGSQRHAPGKKPETLMLRLEKVRDLLRNR